MVKVAPSTFATLAQHPNIVGCKLSHGDTSHHAQIASNPAIDPSHFHAFTGLGQQLLPVMSVGVAGAIDGTAGFFIKLKEAGDDVGIPEILSDHPDSGSRIREIQKEAKRLGCSTEPADPSRWKAFQASLPASKPAEPAAAE